MMPVYFFGRQIAYLRDAFRREMEGIRASAAWHHGDREIIRFLMEKAVERVLASLPVRRRY